MDGDARRGRRQLAFRTAADGELVLAGTVRAGERVYEVRREAGGAHFVREIDPSALRDCDGPARRARGTKQDAGAGAALGLGSGAPVVDVLVLYTGQALAGEGGPAAMAALVDLAEAETNGALANSGFSLRVRVVQAAEVAYSESGSLFTDLERLRFSGDGHMDDAHAARDVFGADVVSLLVDSRQSCGNAYLWNDPPNAAFEAFAFSVVSRHCAASNLSLAHELAHNMGCDHDHAHATPSGGAFPYSHGHQTASGYRTVMALPPGGPRIPYFSDPDATYQGDVLGESSGPNAADNVRRSSRSRRSPPRSAARSPRSSAWG
jgi:hypothetical protein